MPHEATVSDAPGREDREPAAKDHKRFITSLAVITAAGLWIPPLTSSLWTDEAVTHWIIRDGLAELWHRALEFEGESPLYFVIMGGVRRLFGSTEFAMRLPSLLAMALAAYLLYRIARRLADSETGLLAAAVFVAIPGVLFAAADARSYSFAILAVVASTLALVRWAEEGSSRDGVVYILLAALALYFHYFSATALAVHPFYALQRRDQRFMRRFAVGFACVVVSIVPLTWHITALLRRSDSLALPHDVSLALYLAVLFPSTLIGAMGLAALLARWRDRLSVSSQEIAPGGRALIAGLWLIPPTILAAVTLAGSTRLFEGRYLFFGAPGLALMAGSVLRRIAPERSRRVLVLGIAVVSLIAFTTSTHTGDDWRTAATVERSLASDDTPVLFRATLVESAQIEWLTEPEKRDYLLSMTSPYPLRGKIFVLPHRLTTEAHPYLDRIVRRELLAAPRFLLINDGGQYELWLQARLADYAARAVPGGDNVTIVLFEKV